MPDDAVVVAALALFLDLLDERHDLLGATLIRMPVRLDILMKVAAVLAPATSVELERRVAGVHDAVCADLVGPRAHFHGHAFKANALDDNADWTLVGMGHGTRLIGLA
jgi:hypothetical protein